MSASLARADPPRAPLGSVRRLRVARASGPHGTRGRLVKRTRPRRSGRRAPPTCLRAQVDDAARSIGHEVVYIGSSTFGPRLLVMDVRPEFSFAPGPPAAAASRWLDLPREIRRDGRLCVRSRVGYHSGRRRRCTNGNRTLVVARSPSRWPLCCRSSAMPAYRRGRAHRRGRRWSRGQASRCGRGQSSKRHEGVRPVGRRGRRGLPVGCRFYVRLHESVERFLDDAAL